MSIVYYTIVRVIIGSYSVIIVYTCSWPGLDLHLLTCTNSGFIHREVIRVWTNQNNIIIMMITLLLLIKINNDF